MSAFTITLLICERICALVFVPLAGAEWFGEDEIGKRRTARLFLATILFGSAAMITVGLVRVWRAAFPRPEPKVELPRAKVHR